MPWVFFDSNTQSCLFPAETPIAHALGEADATVSVASRGFSKGRPACVQTASRRADFGPRIPPEFLCGITRGRRFLGAEVSLFSQRNEDRMHIAEFVPHNSKRGRFQ